MRRDEAIEKITAFGNKYYPDYYVFNPQAIIDLDIAFFEESVAKFGIEGAYRLVLNSSSSQLIVINKVPYKGITAEQSMDIILGKYDLIENVPVDVLIAMYYPEASVSVKNQITGAINDGHMSHFEFADAYLESILGKEATFRPTFKNIIDNVPVAPPIPTIDLGFTGLSDHDADFLTAIYVGSFNRAAEHDGLKYWSDHLSKSLQSGMSKDDAFKEVARAIYFSGNQNGEMGSQLDDQHYVSFLYENVLGRQADNAGLTYWTNSLETQSITRADFLSVFLTSALAAQGDKDHLEARITVSQFVAQESVTGVKMVDLSAVLRDVGARTNLDKHVQKIVAGDFDVSLLKAMSLIEMPLGIDVAAQSHDVYGGYEEVPSYEITLLGASSLESSDM